MSQYVFSRFRYGGACDLPTASQASALSCKGLYHRYPGNTAEVLQDVTLNVQAGERVALVGPNGAGKSTLLKLILGIEKLEHGEISVYGHPATHCLHRVAIVPQRSTVDWSFPVTVRQVVMMGRFVHLGWFKRPRKIDQEVVDSAMETMDISNIAGRQVSELSGGQQQRVMIARTLAHDADLMLLDEPLNHVDIKTQELIFHTLEKITTKDNKTVIVSTHDLGVLTVHFTRAIFLDKKIIADGTPDKVLTPDTIAEAYGFEFHKDYHPWTS